MITELDSIKIYSKIVADTGDFNAISKYRPTDSTTNPSLIRQACALPEYKNLIRAAIDAEPPSDDGPRGRVTRIIERLFVIFGAKILRHIPGMVSTEIDAAASFDIDAMVEKALKIIKLYGEFNISSEKVYLKIPATWEGIQAAKILKKKDPSIHINMTLIFSLVQAVACAEAHVDLISPFVGRISDYYKNVKGMKVDDPEQDPGVLNVRKIHAYFHHYGFQTMIMGASFRNTGQIKALCGVRALTISPKLLEELNDSIGEVKPFTIDSNRPEKLHIDEQSFRWLMNCDEMASFKLAEGIRLFHQDTELLRSEIEKMIK